MLYTNLAEYYKLINLFIDNKYDAEYVENLIPFERELHINLIMQAQQESDVNRQVEAPED